MNSYLVVLCALFTAAVGRPGYLNNELIEPVAISHQSRIDVIKSTPILTNGEAHHELFDTHIFDDAHSTAFGTIEDLPSLTHDGEIHAEHIILQEEPHELSSLEFVDSEALVHQQIPLFEDELHLNHEVIVEDAHHDTDLHLNPDVLVDDAPLFGDDSYILNHGVIVEDAHHEINQQLPLFGQDLHILNHEDAHQQFPLFEDVIVEDKGLDRHSFTHPVISTLPHEVPLVLISKSPELKW